MKKLMVKIQNKWHTIDFTTNDETNLTTAKTLIEDIKWSKPMTKPSKEREYYVNFYFKRHHSRLFSISNLLTALSDWTKENGAPPEKICLPPEEAIFYSHWTKQPLKELELCGIPVKINYIEKQKIDFFI